MTIRAAAGTVVLALLAGCSVELQHDLSESDANEIYVLLQRNGIDATKVKEGEGKDTHYVISVAKADVATSAQLLKDHSLPRPRADGLAIFKMTKGMIPTATEERAMFIEAVSGEVSNALNRLPGVLEARTIVMIPELNDLAQPDKKPMPSASVLLKYTAENGKPPVSEADVKEFVARAVPELKAEAVKVIMAESKLSGPGTDGEDRLVTHFGVRMEKSSAGTFRMMLALPMLLFLATAGALALVLIRRPGNGGGRSSTQRAQRAANQG